jgi:hypothetical protein
VVGGAGANYSWNCREGLIAGPGNDLPPGECAAATASFTDPVFDYPHEDPGGGAAHGCAVIGGYVVLDHGDANLLLRPRFRWRSTPPPPERRHSFVGLRATHRHVKRHRKAMIAAWVPSWAALHSCTQSRTFLGWRRSFQSVSCAAT